MGVPGLKGRVEANCAMQHQASYFQRGLFYIDGLNLLNRVSRTLPKGQQGPLYDDFVNKIFPIIHSLLFLRPSQLTVYFDVMLPTVEAVSQRFRTGIDLDHVDAHHLTVLHDLFAYLIRKCWPTVNMVLTAMHAEDHIANDIFAASDEHQLHVIFSDDSDCYTFSLPNSHKVEIVPLNVLRNQRFWHTITAVNLKLAHSMVSRGFRKVIPLPQRTIRLGQVKGIKRCDNSPLPRMIFEFIHTIGFYDMPMMCLPVIYSPPGVPEPYEIADGIRITIYGLLLREYGVGEFPAVVEMQQSGRHMITKEYHTFTSAELETEVRYLNNTPIQDIIMEQFDLVASKFELNPDHIEAVGAYVSSAIKNSDIDTVEVLHPAVPKLYSLLKAVLVSLQLFYGTRKCFFNDSTYLLLWKISPYELSSYL